MKRNAAFQDKPVKVYAVVDLKLTHYRGPWRVAAAINNLTNERYYNYAVRSQFVPGRYNAYPQAERGVWVSAQYTF